ncbi:MAG: hypothetical protein WAT35_05190 [Tabrizicola sp.]|uniref:SLOG domain-containing protein n=1 Tax=Tabrizicola sp. TaxID=2005166 RepID=UPI003BB151DE
MTRHGAVFLSASVPQPGRRGFDSFDSLLVSSAVHAFVEVVLGRRLLVWGGQPAITPIIWEAARRLEVPYERCVLLYQSAFFRGHYPEANLRFNNWVEVPAVDGDLRASLVRMRARMLSDRPYEAAVFIGGMEGVIDEFDALRESAPGVRLIPLPTPGGVSRELFERAENLPREMRTRTDFTYWLYRLLDIDPSEPRLLVDAGTGDDDSRSE